MRKPFETADCCNYDVLKEHSIANRNNPTDAERLLWFYLRGDNLGVRFRRQYIVGDYIADFICIRKKLIIEVDGGYHFTEEQQEADAIRTKNLEERGYHVIRFTNEQVMNQTLQVIETIKTYL